MPRNLLERLLPRRHAARGKVDAAGAVRAAAVLALIAALLPCASRRCPPPITVDPATASAAELMALPGVGEVRARALIEARLLAPEAPGGPAAGSGLQSPHASP